MSSGIWGFPTTITKIKENNIIEDEYDIGIPSAFSPNGDGENETLGILGTGFELIDFVIVSRQG
ncbi:MAG: hypothetical protein C0593_14210, partial [Marinilabiliales bacterium]